MTTNAKTTIRPWLFASCLAMAACLAPLAQAEGGRDCPAMGGQVPGGLPGRPAGLPGNLWLGGGDLFPSYLPGLALSESQRDKMFDIVYAQAAQMRDKVKALRRAEDGMRTLVAADDYSEAKARAQGEGLGKAVADVALARVKVERQVLEVLTPEQRKQWASNRGRGDQPTEPGCGRGGRP